MVGRTNFLTSLILCSSVAFRMEPSGSFMQKEEAEVVTSYLIYNLKKPRLSVFRVNI
jgi:hypothetical protein